MLDSSALKWQFWLLWVLASAIAGAAIALVARAAAYSAGYAVGETGGGTVLVEVATGVVALGGILGTIGIAQWLVMVRQVSWASWWLPANALSGAIAGGMTLGLFAALPAIVGEALSAIAGVITGLAVFGITLWLVLRRRVSWAGWLALASVVGIIAGPLVSAVIAALGAGNIGNGAGFGVGYGAITGGALVFFSTRVANSTGAEHSTT